MDNRLFEPFLSSIQSVFKEMASIEVNVLNSFYKENLDMNSMGVSSIIAFAGKIKGRLLIDLEPQLVLKMAENILGETFDTVREYMVLACIQEINNVTAGDGITKINNEYQLGLRLAPPIVFSGKDLIIGVPKIPSFSVDCSTSFGKFKINLAFEGGLE